MKRFAKLSTLAVFLGVAAAALSAGITGKWTGRFDVKFVPPKSGKTYTPDQVKGAQEFLNRLRIILTISTDGTYVAITKGATQQDATTKGKWKLKGKTLTLTPNEKHSPEVGTLSADGKSLTMSLPKDMPERGVRGRAVFSKG